MRVPHAAAFLADPALLEYDGVFYLYPTTDGLIDWSSTSFRVLSSPDLHTWADHGQILTLGQDVAWATAHAWAPAAVERNGRFFLYFSADDSIGVATADSPLGPFVDSGRPIVAAGSHPGRAIDPSVFVDVDGSAYLVWGNGVANVARLSESMVDIDEDSVTSWRDPTFREAAQVHAHDGRYYLSWSENDTRDPEYRVRWAIGTSPMGPWEHGGVLVEQDPDRAIFATGHHTILRRSDGEWLIAYHRFARPGGDGFHREIVIDPLVHTSTTGALEQVVPRLDSIHVIPHPALPVI